MCTGVEIVLLVGAIAGAAGAVQQGQAAKKASEYNAKLSEQNAVLARRQAAEEERRFRVSARKRRGAIEAAYSAAGVTVEGSPTDILAEDMYTSELDALTIREGGEASASAYESQARLDKMYGRAQQTASYYSAASELLSGGTAAYKMNQTNSPAASTS